MLLGEFIVASIIVSVSFANEENKSDFNLESANEASSCEVKMSAAFSVVKTELSYIYNKLDTLGKNNHDLEENMRGKFHKLEKNILDKLEEYIEGKLDSMEKNTNRRIDTLESNIPDKTDTIIIHQKLEALKKMHIESDVNLIYKSKTFANESLPQINEIINQHWLIPEIQEIVKHNLDALTKKSPASSEENINVKLDAMEKSIKENINRTFYTLNNTITNNIKRLDEEISKKNTQPNRTLGHWDCKKQDVKGYVYSPIRMDNATLNYVTLNTDAGGLTHFEMELAIKGKDIAMIQLSSVENPGKGDSYFVIDIGESAKTRLYMTRHTLDDIHNPTFYTELHVIGTPGILSETKFKPYYVKIDNETLEFGEKDTNSTPIFKYRDSRFRALKYIGFTAWSTYQASFLFDCPPNFEGTLL